MAQVFYPVANIDDERMRDMTIIIAAVATGLIGANFFYQAFSGHDYAAATERSFFQGVALFAVWLVLSVRTAVG